MGGRRNQQSCLITWLAIKKALRTQDKLLLWGTITNSSCALCSSAIGESEENLFFKCAVQVLNSIISDIQLKLTFNELQLEDSANNRQFMSKVNVPVKYFHKKIIKCSWTRPVDGEYMINSDGSLSGSSKGVSVPYHELRGIRMGLQGAINKYIKRVCLGTDSALFDQFRMIHIFRESNKAADHLVGLYPGMEFLIVDVNAFSADWQKIVDLDAAGHTYDRV
ncbi:hypothetical protein GIB67_023486 [Kingdonia uniflora]|uniref:Reverse transcriptase zinc-binding domain-containing protein n=1 Tax=Kingdonia uniflora TaxID=39325 RepID=A0A7J7P9P6_9MAGN|nr:hypothetical protein GIB67_023486 [Kingdonia uniflora]